MSILDKALDVLAPKPKPQRRLTPEEEARVLAEHEAQVLKDLSAGTLQTDVPVSSNLVRDTLLMAFNVEAQRVADSIPAVLEDHGLAYDGLQITSDYLRNMDGVRQALEEFHTPFALGERHLQAFVAYVQRIPQDTVNGLVQTTVGERDRVQLLMRGTFREFVKQQLRIKNEDKYLEAKEEEANADAHAALYDDKDPTKAPDYAITTPMLEMEEVPGTNGNARLYRIDYDINPRNGA